MLRAGVASNAARAAPSTFSLGAGSHLFYSFPQPFFPLSSWVQGLQLKCVTRGLRVPCRPPQALPESTRPWTDYWKRPPPAEPLGDQATAYAQWKQTHCSAPWQPEFPEQPSSWKPGHALRTEPTCGSSRTDTETDQVLGFPM